MGSKRSRPERDVRSEERERSRVRDQFGVVLALLMVTVFFSISAPNEPWAWLATTATLAASLTFAMLASGAQQRVVRAGMILAAAGLGLSFVVALTQAEQDARRYLSAGTRSDYTYFSFVTMATVGYGDLTAEGGIGRALAVTEGLLGQIYLVTTVAALVGNLGRTRTPLEEIDERAPQRDKEEPG